MAMAAMQATACSVRAASAISVASSVSCRSSQAALSCVLPQRPRKNRLHSSSSSSCRAGNVGRKCSRLDIQSGIKLDERRSVTAEDFKEVEILEDSSGFFEKAFLTAAIVVMPVVDVEGALATGGEFGLLEGRSLALIHPIIMAGLFAYTCYAGFLGWQWRRVRTIQTEITELKKQVQKVPVAAGESSTPPSPASPVEAQINSLTEERKELVKGGFRDRHFNAGSILLGLGVFESIGGCVNTWFRTGKLFPGPHLFAGATITCCWALAAALVPAMQKGNETARNLHIGLNLINVALFVWQIPTGWEIVLKVFEFTTWP
ncbi:unnamed protein product [Calypogeia fissa]